MIRIEDVAKKANVSTMTVSRVINSPEKVKPATREKVTKVIKEMNYRPNLIAKSLVSGSAKTIGVLYSNIYNQAYLDMIMGIDEIAYSNNYTIMSSNVDDYESAVRGLEMFLSNHVQGIIVLPMEMRMSTREDFRLGIAEMGRFYRYLESAIEKTGTPTVTVSMKCGNIPNISFDFPRLAEIAVNYLIDKGKKNIALITSIIQEGLWEEKEKVYTEIMRSNGLEKYIKIIREPATVQGGHIAMARLCGGSDVPEAVMCANDYIAIGAVQSAWSNGFKVPDDISIIGNDDISLCEMTFPKLTTVSLNSCKAGQTAINSLISVINNEKVNDNVVEHFIVERSSVK
jgi:LacI family transcriptional regulator